MMVCMRTLVAFLPSVTSLIGCFLAALLLAGCATPALYNAFDPSKQVRISSEDITEEELQHKKRAYIKHPAYFLVEETPNQKVLVAANDASEEELKQRHSVYTRHPAYFMVEKSPWQKTRDYAILTVGLPCAVVVDACLIVGGLGVYLWLESHTCDDD